jgi:putative membrane protein
VLLRRGFARRELVIVPLPRVQSLELRQGPLLRRLRLASVRLHTVSGPVDAYLGALDAADATRFFGESGDAAVRAAAADTSHRWRTSSAAAAAQPSVPRPAAAR